MAIWHWYGLEGGVFLHEHFLCGSQRRMREFLGICWQRQSAGEKLSSDRERGTESLSKMAD